MITWEDLNMGFKLDDMIGKYKDFARGYLFYVKVDTGTVAGVSLLPDHPYLVSSAKLPAQTIEAIPVPWQGQEYKLGGTSTFEAFDITFKSDVAQELRRNFLVWMNAIHNPVSNEHGLPGNYFGQVDLTQLNGQGGPVMSYSLVNAFPTAIGEVSLDYSTKEISTFNVTFTYQYHVMEGISGGVPATPVSLS